MPVAASPVSAPPSSASGAADSNAATSEGPDCRSLSCNTRLYHDLAVLSRAILAAAQRGDWDEMTSHESACANLVSQIRGRPIEECPPDERQLCVRFIQEILANDAATRDLAQPWMKELEQILHIRRPAPLYSPSLR